MSQYDKKGFDPADDLREAVRVAPWLVLAILYELTAEQWNDLASGRSVLRLQADLNKLSRKTLADYPMLAKSLASDVGGDVLLKLTEGRFLKRFRHRSGRPRPYLLGSGRQLSRVLVRSLWRQYRRDNGLPAVKSKSPRKKRDDAPRRDAA